MNEVSATDRLHSISARTSPYTQIMERIEEAVADAWSIAARDLGITVETDGSLIDEQGHSRRYVVHVADFGRAKGTVCSLIGSTETDDGRALRRLAEEAGYFWSALGRSASSVTPCSCVGPGISPSSWGGPRPTMPSTSHSLSSRQTRS